MKTHPYADAIYEIVPLAAGGFGVKISIQDTSQQRSAGSTEAAAEGWIDSHKSRVQAQSRPGVIFRKSKSTVAR